MDLRICMNCGYIWDNSAELTNGKNCYQCTVNKRPDNNIRDLGRVILELKHSNLIHHGKLRGLK